jgi:beta-glucan synthesis-associated protein KRE6
MQYKPGFDSAYITWVSNSKLAWTFNAGGVGPDTLTEISARLISQEPMYIIVNLGMSRNFGSIDFEHLTFPNHLKVDWIRVYQDPDNINVGCNPKGWETETYIQNHMEAYTNPNMTAWVEPKNGLEGLGYGGKWPGNRLLGQCPGES